MVGSGAMDAGAEVLELAQRIQAPVVSFRSGRGVVSDDSNYGLNCAAGYSGGTRRICSSASARVSSCNTCAGLRAAASLKLLRIDIDAAELARLKPNAGIQRRLRAPRCTAAQCSA